MNLTSIIEAIVFASGTRVSKSFILEKYPEITGRDVDRAVTELQKKYAGDSGVILQYVAGELRMCTNPMYTEYMEVLMRVRDQKVTKTLYETLSIIAYAQPITRGEIETMRGISCDYAIMKLQTQKLIEVVGTRDTPGKPLLFGTTKDFLMKFGLESLSDLPARESLQSRITELNRQYLSQGRDLFTEKPMTDDDLQSLDDSGNGYSDLSPEEFDEMNPYLSEREQHDSYSNDYAGEADNELDIDSEDEE